MYDTDGHELCLIDSGVKSLLNVPIRPNLQVINLHSNFIQRIENLQNVYQLKHLDLSSNQLTYIEGLEGLASLRTLNLSCNFLSDVRGLAGLRSLVKLNLSHNQIEDVSGFKSLHGSDYRLTHLELHGNKLVSRKHVIQCLSGCVNLRQLTLDVDSTPNPLCNHSEYRQEILKGLPQIQSLDNVDRDGISSEKKEVLADIPGLEEYIDYLLSNGNSIASESSQSGGLDVITPKIDQALQYFKQRGITTSSDTSSMCQSEPELDRSLPKQKKDSDSRIEKLEEQLHQLIQLQTAKVQNKSIVSSSDYNDLSDTRQSNVSRLEAERDIQTDDSDTGSRSNSKERKGRKSRKSKIPSYRKSTAASRGHKDVYKKDSGEASVDTSDSQKQPSAYMVEDKSQREDAKSTYVNLMKELEEERERRWKSEQASMKLVDHIKKLQVKVKDGDNLKDTAIEATSRLKQNLTNEREVKLRLQDEVDNLKEQVKAMTQHLSVAKETEDSYKKSLKSLEEVASKMEREKLQQQTHEQKKINEANMKSAALQRETELLRSMVDKQKSQIHQLQDLLANREQQHREELKKHFSPDSQELKEHIDIEVKKSNKDFIRELKNQQEKIDQITKQYSELEDEFRMALQIEASRFNELKEAYQSCSEENAENKQALLAAHRKDEKSSQMLNELTAFVKEQKGRIAELSKSKQEQSSEYKSRLHSLEEYEDEARRKLVQLELLKKDKTKLLAQVEAQDSVISGLKAERKLWGHELAQQGASLAQDRGRLEAKIESFNSEIVILKKSLNKETDALKIKSKMLEDQTETIRKLKEGLVERDEEIKKAREEALKTQRSLEEQLNEERAGSQDVQERLDTLRERKDDLKHQVADLESELEESKKAHSILNSKWKEKSQLIGQLEKQVQQMKDNWENKEKKLTQERNKAVEAASTAIEKLRSVDDSFRKQLEAKESLHQEEINRLEHEKQAELDQAYQKVYEVEEEMRELLRDQDASKKATEEKVKRLTKALGDLQTDLM
ncbi:leucine-rich repeat and coiled-coil domain-containing protein 1-like [Mytilus galloprovincialis]|uniref:leucine-rich repeat and coiled-coil domain-containing protein 1-like n=1 Tax=Mytilus galloprovincialis TaxID=29158 RepID=UPI003F7BD363